MNTANETKTRLSRKRKCNCKNWQKSANNSKTCSNKTKNTNNYSASVETNSRSTSNINNVSGNRANKYARKSSKKAGKKSWLMRFTPKSWRRLPGTGWMSTSVPLMAWKIIMLSITTRSGRSQHLKKEKLSWFSISERHKNDNKKRKILKLTILTTITIKTSLIAGLLLP